jgi:hypothetical protein
MASTGVNTVHCTLGALHEGKPTARALDETAASERVGPWRAEWTRAHLHCDGGAELDLAARVVISVLLGAVIQQRVFVHQTAMHTTSHINAVNSCAHNTKLPAGPPSDN